jgi:hypothetical protein
MSLFYLCARPIFARQNEMRTRFMYTNILHTIAPLNITVIGGCHAIGHYIGKEKGYVAVASNVLNEIGVNHRFETVVFKKINRLANYFDDEKVALPHILIIQLGNYEFSPALRADIQRLWKKLFKKKKPSSSALPKSTRPMRFADFVPTKQFSFYQWIKHLVNKAIFYRYLNRRKWLRHIDRFFSSIKEQGINNVLVLTPRPHINRVTNTYRNNGGELLRRKSEEFGFHFIDMLSLIERKFQGEHIFMIDEGH